MRFLPGPGGIAFLRGWGVDRVVQPAVPFRRHPGRLSPVLVDDPAARHPERADAAPLHVVAVAALVAADEAAAHGRIEAVRPRVAAPPAEDFAQDAHRPHMVLLRSAGRL